MALTRPRSAQINFDAHNVTDPLIRINSGQSGANDKDAGWVVERGSDTNVCLMWDESADEFALVNTTEDGTTSGNVTISSYADLAVKKVTQSEQQYTTSNMMKFNQIYTGASAGSYFTQNEYQKILTIIPSGDAENYQISGRILAQSGGSIQTIEFTAALRSETLPDLSWSITYTDTHNGSAFFKPQLWTKETTTAGFIIAIQKISSGNLYGTVTVDIDVIPRTSSQKSNVTMNTTQDSETTSVDAGYTANDMTKIMEINGDNIDISAHDGSSNGFELAGTLVTATAAELNYSDGVTSNIQTQLDAKASLTGTETLTNKTLTSPTISNPTLTGTYTFTSDATTTPAMTLTANSLNDGVGALRIDGAQADIFLNPATATHTTVTFAVNSDQRLAFGMDNNSDFYITRRTSSTWYDDTFVLDRDTGLLSLGYGATVAGTLTYATLNDGTTALTSTVAELNYMDGVTSNVQTQLDAKAPTAGPTFTGTDGIVIPSGTTVQRPVSPATGTMRFNTTDGRFEGYNGTAWVPIDTLYS